LTEIRNIYDNRYNRSRREEKDTTLAWCFACCVGIRVSDVRRLTPENIKSLEVEGEDIKYLEYRQGKRHGYLVYVPLNDSALKLLDEAKRRNPEYGKHLFRVKTGTDNKGITQNTSVDKKLRFHNSRHSFSQNLRDAGVEDWKIDMLMGKRFSRSDIQHVHYNDTFHNKPKIYMDAVRNLNFLD
jgi:integrase